MESPLASWQVESFSTSAEFSPPISPSPQSPTLYANAHGDDGSMYKIKSEAGLCSPSSRAQLASKLLQHLEFEDYHFSQYENQNEMPWEGEESVNLELFEDLEDFDDLCHTTRPLTPDSQEFQNQEHLQQLDESPQPSPAGEFPSDSFEELSAEFQSILAGLSAQVTTIDNAEVIQLLVPCSLEDIKLNLVQPSDDAGQSNNGNDNANGDDNKSNASEADSLIEMEDQSHTFDEFELQLIGLDVNQSQQGAGCSGTSSPSSSITEDEIDSADDTCENILDALLLGDLNTAKSYLPINMEVEVVAVDPSSTVTHIAPSPASSSNSNKRGKRSLEPTVKSGRSGSSGMKKPRLPSNTDKTQRKKEQNKTAATRYREKKKLQAAIINIQEDALEKVNNELKSQRDDLNRQVLIYKELLRAVMLDRKGKKKSAPQQPLGFGRQTAGKRLVK